MTRKVEGAATVVSKGFKGFVRIMWLIVAVPATVTSNALKELTSLIVTPVPPLMVTGYERGGKLAVRVMVMPWMAVASMGSPPLLIALRSVPAVSVSAGEFTMYSIALSG